MFKSVPYIAGLMLSSIVANASITISGTSIVSTAISGDTTGVFVASDGASFDVSKFTGTGTIAFDTSFAGGTDLLGYTILGAAVINPAGPNGALGSGVTYNLTESVSTGNEIGILTFATSTTSAIAGDSYSIFTGGWTVLSDGVNLSLTGTGAPVVGIAAAGTGTVSAVPNPSTNANLWHSDAAVLADNWRYNDWLGYFNIGTDPWIYHMQHGWLYVFPSVTDTESVYFWDNSMQSVLWTSQAVYPSMYRFSDSTWIWYMKDSSNPRRFNKLGTTNWEEQ